MLSKPNSIKAMVAILETIDAWNDGNPPDEAKFEIQNFFVW